MSNKKRLIRMKKGRRAAKRLGRAAAKSMQKRLLSDVPSLRKQMETDIYKDVREEMKIGLISAANVRTVQCLYCNSENKLPLGTGLFYCTKCQKPFFETSGNEMRLNPPYYSRFKIEPIDFMNANELDYMQGNVIKYVCRYKYKGQPIEDLDKAISYLQKMRKKAETDGKENINRTGQEVRGT